MTTITPAAALEAMLKDPEANMHINKCRELAEHIDFHLYTVEHCSTVANVAG